jgi:hypothetical protein
MSSGSSSKAFSLSRNPQLEAISKRVTLGENSSPAERSYRLREYQESLDRALGRAGIQAPSHEELENALADAYRDFRRSKRLQERARLSRVR